MCSRSGPPARPARGICNERRTPAWAAPPPVQGTTYTVGAATLFDSTGSVAATPTYDITSDTFTVTMTTTTTTPIQIAAGGTITWQPERPNLGFFARQGRRLDIALFQCGESVRIARRSIRSTLVSTANRMRNAGSMMPSLSVSLNRRLLPALLAGPVLALLLG